MSLNVPPEPQIEQKSKGMRIMSGKLGAAYVVAQSRAAKGVKNLWGDVVPIILPTVEPQQIYVDKAGPEVLGQMYVFKDRSERDLCLRPEATATCQLLAQSTYKTFPDLKLFYWQKCFRYERPQAGRYREFTQFGIEILNPTKDWTNDLIYAARVLMRSVFNVGEVQYDVCRGVKRGLGIYNDTGFEFVAESLGAQKQILGGGPYENGQGFAIGVDRVLLLDGVTDGLAEDWRENRF